VHFESLANYNDRMDCVCFFAASGIDFMCSDP
jgi:hypothetical protein